MQLPSPLRYPKIDQDITSMQAGPLFVSKYFIIHDLMPGVPLEKAFRYADSAAHLLWCPWGHPKST
jgi:hypothetical protein